MHFRGASPAGLAGLAGVFRLVGPAFVLVASFGLAVACSSDPEDSPPAEPTTPPLGGTDAGSSGSSGSSGGTDGSSGGTDSNTSSGGPFCASLSPKPGVCEDFDDNTPPWAANEAAPTVGDVDKATGGSVTIEKGGISKSGPNALKVTGTDLKETVFRLPSNDVTGTAKTLAVGFSYRSEAAPPTQGTMSILRVFLANNHQIVLELTSQDGAGVREDGDNVYESVKLNKLPTAKAWIRYELLIDIAGKKLVLNADGAKVAEKTLKAPGYDLFAANFGVATDGPDYTAYFDDIVVDLK
jgi:hypothetical protein